MRTVDVVREIDRPALLFGPRVEPERAAGPTLEDVVGGAWSELRRRAVAVCPVCGGRMQARWGAGPAPVGGRCDGCGSELS